MYKSFPESIYVLCAVNAFCIYTYKRESVVVNALCYKPEVRGFETQWRKFINLPNPSGRTRPWGLLSL
jgi:hypothetical protein